MKSFILKLILCAVLIFNGKAHAGANYFWIDNISVTSSPSNPLTGASFGNFQGSFSAVNWVGTNLGSMSGNFTISTGWQETSFGIPWSVDNGLDAIVFDTDPGDTLLFGSAGLTLGSTPSGYTLCETKTLICANLESTLNADVAAASFGGETLYYGYKTDTDRFAFTYDGKSQIIFEEALFKSPGVYETENLSFFRSSDGGKTITEFTRGLQFDTGVKIGGCVCVVVPEPSSALSIAVTGVVLVLRRRRKA